MMSETMSTKTHQKLIANEDFQMGIRKCYSGSVKTRSGFRLSDNLPGWAWMAWIPTKFLLYLQLSPAWGQSLSLTASFFRVTTNLNFPLFWLKCQILQSDSTALPPRSWKTDISALVIRGSNANNRDEEKKNQN